MLYFDRYYVVKSGDKITTSAFWNPRLKHLDARIAEVEDQKSNLDAVIEEGRTVFRDKANDVLVPLIGEVYDLANVGVMLRATSSTEHDPTVTGGKTFIIDEGQRLRFAAPAYVAVYRMTSPQAAMLGEVVSYDADTGELVVDVDRVSGAGYGGGWTITVASPSDTAEAIAEVLAAQAVIEAVGETVTTAAGQAVAAKEQTETMRGEVQGLTNSNNTLAGQIADDAEQVALDRQTSVDAAAAAVGAAGESQTARNASQQAATTAGEKATLAGNNAQAALTYKGAAEQALTTVTTLHGEVETYHEQAGGFKEAAEAAADRSETAETNINAAAANVSQVHLGGWPADPIMDLAGNPIVSGATYWNTTDKKIKVYDDGAWTISVVPVGSEVTSIFGRTGNIGAVLGDYSADKITVTAITGVTGTTVQQMLASLKAIADGKSASGHAHTFASLTAKPTSLNGYGISDAYTQTQINGFLADKLDVSGFTANAIITKLKEVDGTGSGLDADTLRGLSIGTTGQAVFIASTQAAARSALGLGTAATQNSTAFAAAVHGHAIDDTTGLQAALDSKPAKTATITGTGLATGGGDLSANRAINVPAASQAQAQAGTDNATVMTPLRAKEAINALVPAADTATAGKARFATPADAQTSVNIAVDPALLKQRIDEAIAALLDGAPGSIDTLNELAAALGDDPNFAATVTSSIATKLNATAVSNFVLSNLLGVGDAGAFKTVLGLNLVNNTSDVDAPVSTAQQAALNLKANASDLTTTNNTVATKLNRSGGTMTGPLTLYGSPTSDQDAISKAYATGLIDAIPQTTGAGEEETPGLVSPATLAGLGGGSILAQTYVTVGGTHDFHADANFAYIEVQGGGNNGGSASDSNSRSAAGGGGQAGSISEKLIPVTGGGSATCTIGSVGGTSIYEDGTYTITAPGGSNGGNGSSSSNQRTLGSPGTSGSAPSGGDINKVGEFGGVPAPQNYYPGVVAGHGGSSKFGRGGKGGDVFTTSTGANPTQSGSAGSGYGAGGGGAANYNYNGTVSGGSGTQGVIRITEYA